MKVIFLDIDGVLNHYYWYRERRSISNLPHPLDDFDPKSVSYLNNITDKTGAKIIISSSWRFDPDIINILHKVGITGEIIGCTPDLYNTYGSLCRGKEIDVILNKLTNIERYIILDDDTDMEQHQLPYFLKTNANGSGLNKTIMNKAIKILNDV
jgi:hypothetical protein